MDAFVKKLDKIVNGFLSWITVIMLAVMSLVVFLQVIVRGVHGSIPWSTELSQYLLIWCTFLGSALCVRKGSLVGLEIIYMIVPKKWGKQIVLCINILTSLFLLFLVVVGYNTAGLIIHQTSAVLKVSMGFMYASIPTGAFFMLINEFIVCYYLVKGEDAK
jgi:TRAP-type C4-dicarboxylate transport system permease small subunit